MPLSIDHNSMDLCRKRFCYAADASWSFHYCSVQHSRTHRRRRRPGHSVFLPLTSSRIVCGRHTSHQYTSHKCFINAVKSSPQDQVCSLLCGSGSERGRRTLQAGRRRTYEERMSTASMKRLFRTLLTCNQLRQDGPLRGGTTS